jgi:hypothetical protein
MFFGIGTFVVIGIIGVYIYVVTCKCWKQHRKIRFYEEVLRQYNITHAELEKIKRRKPADADSTA